MDQIIQNLRDARAIISAAPVEQINLMFFAQPNDCGTLYCAAGWLSQSPRFKGIMQLIWIERVLDIGPPYAMLVQPGDRPNPLITEPSDFLWLDEHFGPRAFHRLFAMYGDGEFDIDHQGIDMDPLNQFEFNRNAVSDKDLALWRIDQQLKELQG